MLFTIPGREYTYSTLKMWHAVFFLRDWHQWILLCPQYYLQKNLVTCTCVTAHALINYDCGSFFHGSERGSQVMWKSILSSHLHMKSYTNSSRNVEIKKPKIPYEMKISKSSSYPFFPGCEPLGTGNIEVTTVCIPHVRWTMEHAVCALIQVILSCSLCIQASFCSFRILE